MINFASCFMIGKAHGWWTISKCKVRLSYRLVLGLLFWESPTLGHYPTLKHLENKNWWVVAKSNTSPTLVNTSQIMYSMGSNNAEILNFENCCACVFTRLVCWSSRDFVLNISATFLLRFWLMQTTNKSLVKFVAWTLRSVEAEWC
jgi:hypothetical protein